MEEKCNNNIAVELRAEEVDEEEEEALSLSDLPLFHQWRKDQRNIEEEEEEEESIRSPLMEVKDDFDFCSASKESEMCAADELFFKGRILPFRHSVSSTSEPGLLRSGSMDRYYSGGFISSRSSSINSHHSMTSSSSSSSAAGCGGGGCSIPAAVRRPKLPPPRNQFQYSHPSPSPRLHFPSQRTKIAAGRNYAAAKSSPPWNIFRLGLIAAPPDLKTRCPSSKNNFGSRNSNSSSISSGSNSNAKKKKKARVNLLGGGGGACRSCSSDAVDTVAPRNVFYKRCSSEGDVAKALLDLQRRKSNNAEDSTNKHVAKKRLSHHRTFEWLKQLSLEEDES